MYEKMKKITSKKAGSKRETNKIRKAVYDKLQKKTAIKAKTVVWNRDSEKKQTARQIKTKNTLCQVAQASTKTKTMRSFQGEESKCIRGYYTNNACVNAKKPENNVKQLVQIKKDGDEYYNEKHEGGVPIDTLDIADTQVLLKILHGKTKIDAETVSEIKKVHKKISEYKEGVIPEMGFKGLSRRSKLKAIDAYKKSMDTSTLKGLIEGQKEWQDELADNSIEMKTILAKNRSFGLEYEFATWEKKEGVSDDVESHTELGQSEAFSRLFGLPFIIETDAQNEIELVVPPLLASSDNGAINKKFIKDVDSLFISELETLRKTAQKSTINNIEFAKCGVGNNWKWIAAANKIRIAETRKKWVHADNKVGKQLNLTMTAKEIAEIITSDQDDTHSIIEHKRLYLLIKDNYLVPLIKEECKEKQINEKSELMDAAVILAKGLANTTAIPSIKIINLTRMPFGGGEGLIDLHSHVKDLHGIWIKDNVPNTTIAALGNDAGTIDIFATVLRKASEKIVSIIERSIPKYKKTVEKNKKATGLAIGNADTKEREKRAREQLEPTGNELSELVKKEASACLTTIIMKISGNGNGNETSTIENKKTDFLKEEFGSGLGVRKDTYLNIGNDANDRKLHLAELRTNKDVNRFLQ